MKRFSYVDVGKEGKEAKRERVQQKIEAHTTCGTTCLIQTKID